jgi:hypothetical protein
VDKITSWLEALDLAECAPRFVENDIDFAILGELSDQDLKELGISSLGRLYRATDRGAEACAFLAPALEGFVEAAELPEIEEARLLLAGLS